MAELEEEIVAAETALRRRWPMVLGLVAGVLALALLYAWLTREDIAENVISSQLNQMELPASYKIESIGPRREVLTDIVIGDPKRPDLTIERAEIEVTLRFGPPKIGAVKLVRPRLYSRYHDGKLSFGSLDRLLFTGRKQAFRLPQLDLAIEDGRGLMESNFGNVGFKLEGRGQLRGGFTGVLAAAAPSLAVSGCQATRASLYGTIKVSAERPHFAGPLRLAGIACPAQRFALRNAAVQLDTGIDPAFDGADGQLGLSAGAFSFGDGHAAGSEGTLKFAYRKHALTAQFRLAGKGLATPQAAAADFGADGVFRSQDGFDRIEVEASFDGSGLRPGDGLDKALAGFEQSGRKTLAAPMLAQVRAALRREGPGSRATGSLVLRKTGSLLSLVVPQASLRGGSGQTLLDLSRFQISTGGAAGPRISGNFTSGGAGLPQIAGRMERQGGRDLMLRLTMAEYRAGTARLAIPELMVVQGGGGAIGFAGSARLSGDLPGGRASNVALPIEGNWSPAAGLSVWRKCTALRFDSLSLANLTIDRRELTLCPPPGGAILRFDGRGTRFAAGAPSLNVAGRLGSTPIRIASGPVGFAMPGVLAARRLDIMLGSANKASRFRITELRANVGKDVSGKFGGADVFLNAVPLDLLDASGNWRFANGRLDISNGAFRLEDRKLDDRFRPLVARDGILALVDNAVTASATMREPRSDRAVTRVDIHHDLSIGRGHADLAVDGVTFDRGLQPDTLSRVALGVIANAQGVVRGTGRIDWTADKVTSTGSFTTDALDFAASFGPVKGASGTVVFTDLIGLVTAPDQRLRIASINPGIEANDGELSFELKPDLVLQVNGASWPFLDGRLSLEPVRMLLGAAETRQYILRIEGLDAAKFVERMELANLSATGRFDGTLPLVFDQNGGRIVGGLLNSRPPGGNVSYVGALTYKDLSAMANFAFDALRSMDYRQMRIAMDGALEGEIVTRVRMDGVTQGAGAKRNILTERIAKLPIQFNINLRAPFYQLITSFKAMYDPAFVKDPRDLGLIDANGRPIKAGIVNPPLPPITPSDIQPSDSRTTP